MDIQFDLLNYLLTSDFSNMDDASPDKFKDLLTQFRYEYRLLSGKNTSLVSEIDKLKGDNNNLINLVKEKNFKYESKIASLEDELHFLKPKLNRKLTWKERLHGKIEQK
jgi:hypothetical protein